MSTVQAVRTVDACHTLAPACYIGQHPFRLLETEERSVFAPADGPWLRAVVLNRLMCCLLCHRGCRCRLAMTTCAATSSLHSAEIVVRGAAQPCGREIHGCIHVETLSQVASCKRCAVKGKQIHSQSTTAEPGVARSSSQKRQAMGLHMSIECLQDKVYETYLLTAGVVSSSTAGFPAVWKAGASCPIRPNSALIVCELSHASVYGVHDNRVYQFSPARLLSSPCV